MITQALQLSETTVMSRVLRALVVCLLFLLSCGGAEITRSSPPMLEGQLSENGTGRSLAGVLISLRESGAYLSTDEAGAYAFYTLPEGPDTLVIHQSPWLRLEEPVSLQRGRTRIHNLVLQRDAELPWLELSPDSLDFDWDESLLNLQVHNRGGGQLDWSVQDVPTWLDVQPQSGSGDASVTLEMRRSQLSGPLDLRSVLRVSSNGGTLSLPVKARVLEYPDLIVENLLVEPVEFSVNGEVRTTLGLGGSERLLMNTDHVQVRWTVQQRFWEGQLLGNPFGFTGAELVLTNDLTVFAVNQISLSNGQNFRIFSPSIHNEDGGDLFLVVNYNTSREWLGYARIPAGETFLGGYYDAGGSTDPVNVMLFPDTTDADHFFFLGDIPAGRQITEPRSSEADLRAAFQVNSGLVLINCCNGATQFPNGAEVLMLESAQ